jgi:membrane-associated phospholipid phosphatase
MCGLNPQQGQVAVGSPLTTTLTVSTTGTGSTATLNGAWLPSGAALAALFFVGFLPRRRWKNTALLVLLGITVGCAAIGCGGSGSQQTTTGSYQVVVTASSATVTASTTIALALQ